MKLQKKAIKAVFKLCMQCLLFMMSHIQSSVRSASSSAVAVFKVAAKITL